MHGLDENGTPVDAAWHYRGPESEHDNARQVVRFEDLTRKDTDAPSSTSGEASEIGVFDPREQALEEAVESMMPALRARLRETLEDIAAADLNADLVVEPVGFRSPKPFEWLERYQVLGQSRTRIASADGIDRTRVSRAVKKTAKLIGLTPREEKGGRPRAKRKANSKRIL